MWGYRRAAQIELNHLEADLQRLVEDPKLADHHRAQIVNLRDRVDRAQNVLWMSRPPRGRHTKGETE